MQQDVKTKIQTAVNQRSYPGALVAIVVEKNKLKDIAWIEKGKEMLLDNQRYDVVNVSENKHAVTFYCINDKAETALYADLEHHVKSDITPDKPSKSGPLKKLLEKQTKLFFSGETILIPVHFTEKQAPIYTTAVFYHPPQSTPPAPPPEPFLL